MWRWLPLLLVAGCAFDGDDLAHWKDTANGPKRLAGYLADSDRPMPLRQQAAEHLFVKDQLDQIMGVVKTADPVERKALLKFLVDFTVQIYASQADGTVHGRAASLAYYMLSYADDLDKGFDKKLVEPTVGWSLEQFGNPDAPATRVKTRSILLGSATARPAIAVPLMLAHMRDLRRQAATDHALDRAALKAGKPKDAQNHRLTYSRKLQTLLRLSGLLGELREAEVQKQVAHVLLEAAKELYPHVPESLAEAMIANGDETLLRFLLDAVRDHRVPDGTRDTGLRVARDMLRGKAIDQLLTLVGTDDPSVNNVPRMSALDALWDFGTVEYLDKALKRLPPGGTWPTDGEDFKAEIDLFCDNRVARMKKEALPVLARLTSVENWVARIYAIECIIRLHPARAPELLEGLETDETPLRGWSVDGPTTIGDVVRSVTEG